MVGPLQVFFFLARSVHGRIQVGAKIGHGGPFLQRTSSSDWKATSTNRIHSNDLQACGMKHGYFWFHSEVKYLTRFWHLFGLTHFAFFSSPEPKARVSYCHSAPSVVRPSVRKLFTFSTSSPEPLDGLWWNLVGMKYSWSLTSVVVFRPDPPRGGSMAGPK